MFSKTSGELKTPLYLTINCQGVEYRSRKMQGLQVVNSRPHVVYVVIYYTGADSSELFHLLMFGSITVAILS